MTRLIAMITMWSLGLPPARGELVDMARQVAGFLVGVTLMGTALAMALDVI